MNSFESLRPAGLNSRACSWARREPESVVVAMLAGDRNQIDVPMP